MQTNKSINTRSFTLFVCCDCGGGLSQDEVTILYICECDRGCQNILMKFWCS